MKISIDKDIPGLAPSLSSLGDIAFYSPQTVNRNELKDSDVLVVRSILKVDRNILHNTAIKVVASVTSGIDHINTRDLKNSGITLYSASGCNAWAVVEYVLAATLQGLFTVKFQPSSFSIIGMGHAGSLLAKTLTDYGFRVVFYDPYKDIKQFSFSDRLLAGALEEAMSSDVIFLHPSLHANKPYPSKNLITDKVIQYCPEKCLLINTSRGEIIDDKAFTLFTESPFHYVITDVFPNESMVPISHIRSCLFASPHIAGYTKQAKQNANYDVIKSLHNHFNKEFSLKSNKTKADRAIRLPNDNLFANENSQFTKRYINLNAIHNELLAQCKIAEDKTKKIAMEPFRKNYPLRNEWSV